MPQSKGIDERALMKQYGYTDKQWAYVKKFAQEKNLSLEEAARILSPEEE